MKNLEKDSLIWSLTTVFTLILSQDILENILFKVICSYLEIDDDLQNEDIRLKKWAFMFSF